jgi:hypothetical protein
MKWKKELEALVKDTEAFVKSVARTSPATLPIVGQPPESVAETHVRGTQTEAEASAQDTSLVPQPKPSCDNFRCVAPPVTGSERGDIERHIEQYRARQRNRLQENDLNYEREIAGIRARLKAPPK